MTPRERTAFNEGVRAAQQMARVVAVTMETAEDANGLRQRAAAAALSGFAEGVTVLLLDQKADPAAAAMETVAALPGASGEITCPACAGRLRWVRDSYNGHLSMVCETADCLAAMQ